MTLQELIALNEKKNGGKAAPSEHALQVACVRWFRYAYPWPRYLIFSIPNGGYRTETTARAMKAEGQEPGIPDLCIPMARKGYHGLYIELKNGKSGTVIQTSKGEDRISHSRGLFGRNLQKFDRISKNRAKLFCYIKNLYYLCSILLHSKRILMVALSVLRSDGAFLCLTD